MSNFSNFLIKFALSSFSKSFCLVLSFCCLRGHFMLFVVSHYASMLESRNDFKHINITNFCNIIIEFDFFFKISIVYCHVQSLSINICHFLSLIF